MNDGTKLFAIVASALVLITAILTGGLTHYYLEEARICSAQGLVQKPNQHSGYYWEKP